MQWERIIASYLTEELNAFKHVPGTNPGYVVYKAASDLEKGMNAETWCDQLLELINTSYEKMRHAVSPTDSNTWRKIYTDSCILRGIAQFLLCRNLEAITTLDHAIIIAGAPTRLQLVLGAIRKIQTHILWAHTLHKGLGIFPPEATPEFQKSTIPELNPPSFFGFQSRFSQKPFILRDFACNWPALHDRPWRSVAYLLSVAGPGRVIPVEVGHDYRSTTWSQKIVPWEFFLSTLDFIDRPASESGGNILYLAQHDLTVQFPSLRDDILVPDYVYTSLSCSDYPNYQPPPNDDKILFNTWLGPRGTVSPAHTDPYYNCYGTPSSPHIGITSSVNFPVQVVGHKSVWLAPPLASPSMACMFSSKLCEGSSEPRPSNDVMSNTSQIDVFSGPEGLEDFPAFVENVLPVSMSATLSPGDVLFFPPGWWHAMKSESTSFSFSMWF